MAISYFLRRRVLDGNFWGRGFLPAEYLDMLFKEPFQAFTFAPVGAAVCHVGTAAEKLKEWDLKPQRPLRFIVFYGSFRASV